MNKKGQGEIIIYAGVFVILFFLGGIFGSLSLPDFPGRFFVSGLIFAIFGTGAGVVIIKVIFNH